jgi:hypothetical protein
MSKVFSGETENPGKIQADYRKKRSKIRSPDQPKSSKEIHPLNHLLFENISSVQFCVDSAVGLPLFATATRVTARLLAADRKQIGENSAPSYSFPESDALSPLYDLHMSWRGKPSFVFLKSSFFSSFHIIICSQENRCKHLLQSFAASIRSKTPL